MTAKRNPGLSRRDTLLATTYAWACEQIYHDMAWAYDAVSWSVSGGAWSDWRRLALDAASGQMLELGFGTGELIATALQQRRPIIGLEQSPQMHAIALGKLRRSRVPPPIVRGSALALPFADASFDSVIATFPARYIVEPAALAECGRVLKTDGRLIIAGVWVVPMLGQRAVNLPLLYCAPGASESANFLARIEAEGFVAKIDWQRVRWAAVAVVTANRPPVSTGSRHAP